MEMKEIHSKCWKEGNYYIIETDGVKFPYIPNATLPPKYTKAKFKCRLKSPKNISIRLNNLYQENGKPLEIRETEAGLNVIADLKITEHNKFLQEKCDSKDFLALSLVNISAGEIYRRCHLGTIIFYIILKYIVDLCYNEFQSHNTKKRYIYQR